VNQKEMLFPHCVTKSLPKRNKSKLQQLVRLTILYVTSLGRRKSHATDRNNGRNDVKSANWVATLSITAAILAAFCNCEVMKLYEANAKKPRRAALFHSKAQSRLIHRDPTVNRRSKMAGRFRTTTLDKILIELFRKVKFRQPKTTPYRLELPVKTN
jgi:hypothetical protein